ncbi:response regulator [Paenibacillus sp. GD4]|uniref:response regulator n=1 Tax=Paenibacillus sp. GD4 TaxID=3068890 RepID=UPI002796AFA6|nr:response regulator [Paenibacillus sp. GD4]MDQ1913540.1 response regulator [Paenibacillus sp. GD4]
MNLMIVEDEIGIRTRMAATIPWEENGIDVVGLAENGLEALQMMERTKPDIVILDIQMPEMDGLTLARYIFETDSQIKIIILSGYEDFDYARSAMESGVLKYLIKPASNEEILSAVLEAASLLRKELEERLNQETLALKWKSNLPRLQESFFNNWISGAYSDWDIETRGRELLIPLEPEGALTVAVLEPDPLTEGELRFTDQDSALLQFSLRSIAGELITDRGAGVFQDLRGSTVVLFQSAEGESHGDLQLRVGFTITKVLSAIKECLKVTASAGISGVAEGRKRVPSLYEQARSALQKRVIYGHDIAIPYTEEREDYESVPPVTSDERDLEIGIETGDALKAETALERLLQEAISPEASVEEVQDQLLYLMHTLLRIIRTQNWPLRESMEEDVTYFHNLQSLHTSEQIKNCLHRIVRKMAAYAQKRAQTGGGHKLIQKLLTIIEEEIGQEISLHAIAGRFFVNKSYLSRLFKHEMGESFSQYVLKRKMIRAKQLLLEGGQVQYAAGQVGYTNIGFFSKVFQKYWGVLPSEVKQG